MPEGGNLRGCLYLHFDQSSILAYEAYDFKGKPSSQHAASVARVSTGT